MRMMQMAIGLLVCVFGALSLPVNASAHVSRSDSGIAAPRGRSINWTSVRFPTAPPVPGGHDSTRAR